MKSVARAAFIDRCDGVISALDDIASIQVATQSPAGRASRPESSTSLIIQGLTVVFYAAFEDFLTGVSLELLKTINPQSVSIDELPPGLRKEMAEGAMRTLVSRLRFLSKDAIEAVIAKEAGHIASVSEQNRYAFSRYMFMPRATNVSTSDVTEYLKRVCVANPWKSLNSITDRIGNGSPSLVEAVQADSKRRNRAAHESNPSITAGDLGDMVKRLRAVALAYEAVLNRALTHIEAGECQGDGCKLEDSDLNVEVLFIEKVSKSSEFRIIREGYAKAVRRCSSLEEAVDHASSLRRLRAGITVLRGADGMASRWWV